MNRESIDKEIARLEAERVSLVAQERAAKRQAEQARLKAAGESYRALVARYNEAERAHAVAREALFRALVAEPATATVYFAGGQQWSCNLLRRPDGEVERQANESAAMRLFPGVVAKVQSSDFDAN